jgi:hypothetical protein
MMRIKIVDERKRVLHDEKILDRSTVMSVYGLSAEYKKDDYILKDVIFIRNDGSDVVKDFFVGLDIEPNDELVIIEVERVTDLGDPEWGGHNEKI